MSSITGFGSGGSSSAITQINGNTGTAVPVAGVVNVVGDASTILTSGSGNTLTIASSTGMIFWDTQTATNAPFIVLDVLNTAYVNYVLYYSNFTSLDPSLPFIGLEISNDAGATWITSGYFDQSGVDNGSFIIGTHYETDSVTSGVVYLNNFTTGVGTMMCSINSSSYRPTAVQMSFDLTTGAYTSAVLVNRIRVRLSSGGLFSGRFYLYALTNP